MRAGWPRFARRHAPSAAAAPDNAVTAPPAWLLAAVIVASTAALLGTSEVPDPSDYTTYTFARSNIDGGFVELTTDQPAATFFISVHADDLGPEGVITTGDALATIDGMLTATGLAEGVAVPAVSIRLGAPEGGGTDTLVSDHINQKQPLLFGGDCANPKTNASCTARFTLAVSRQDQGENGGVVRFDWLFDVESKGKAPSKTTSEVGPLDPPWTIQVSQP